MSWLTYAFLSMFGKTAQSFTEKKSQNQIGSFLTFFLLVLISTIFILPFVVTLSLPSVNSKFWIGVIGSVVVYLFAKPLRLFALGRGDLSEIAPLVSLNAVFSLVFAWIFLREIPSFWGIIGVLLISGGGYLMNFDNTKLGAFNKLIHPIKHLFQSKNQLYLLFSVILSPISSIFDKFAINNTIPRSPHHVLMTENLLILPLLVPILFWRKVKIEKLKSVSGWKTPIILGAIFALTNVITFSAINIGKVGYVTAIRQLSGLMAVLIGYYVLKEGNLRKRLISAVIMAAGAFLVSYLG